MRSNMTHSLTGWTGGLKAAAIGVLGLMSATSATAAYDPAHQFVTNGGFEQTTNGLGELVQSTNLVGWTSSSDGDGNYGYNFVLNTSTASTSGSPSEYGQLKLWGPGNGVNNGLTASPTGGNFVGGDGAYHTGYLYQAINNLIVGQTYTLSFNYAGAQEKGYDGATQESWYYGLASTFNTQTAVLNNVNHGFTGWKTQTYNFVATRTSDTLYFLAEGAPDGQPPFSLLDSVSLVGGYGTVSAAPDPSTWMTLILGLGMVGVSMRRRPRNRATMAFAAA